MMSHAKILLNWNLLTLKTALKRDIAICMKRQTTDWEKNVQNTSFIKDLYPNCGGKNQQYENDKETGKRWEQTSQQRCYRNREHAYEKVPNITCHYGIVN